MTECKQEVFEFQVHGSRKVTGDFSGGYLSSDGGAVFLRGVDLKIGLIRPKLDADESKVAKHKVSGRSSKTKLLVHFLQMRFEGIDCQK